MHLVVALDRVRIAHQHDRRAAVTAPEFTHHGQNVGQPCAIGQGPVAGWLSARADLLGRRESLAHEQFKAALPGVAFAVRTGEQTPYANVILTCGVPF